MTLDGMLLSNVGVVPMARYHDREDRKLGWLAAAVAILLSLPFLAQQYPNLFGLVLP